jgi:hypothetical protein
MMVLQPPTQELLSYLQSHPEIRRQIRAAPDKTLVYAGYFFKPMWKEIADLKHRYPEVADKDTLPDVLKRIPVPGTSHSNLLAYVQDVEQKVPWKPDGFTLWKELSALYASGAKGAVSFQIGSGVSPSAKVFAATEVDALLSNPDVDPTTKDMLAYYQRCIQMGQTDINVGFISR